ncbi:Secreted protein OS=Streptomyces glaucescens OX=1907 GN=SGLAU_11735 PE=4 SV=1 [Streptomyces glaucescens]
MEAAIAVVALLFVLFIALGAYATVKVVGAAKRGVDRTITQARRTVEDHTLRAKSFVQPGPAGEIAQLRLRLRTSMRATQDALHAGAAGDQSLQESLALFQRLSAHGHELDADLRRLESEPDRASLAERLPGLRERTERITHSADSLRWAARDRAHRFADDDLDTLSAQIDVEAGALRHWTTEDPAGSSSSSSAATPPPWPEAPAGADAATHQQTWPDTSQARTDEERPAITPPAPRPAYPWQKKPRPESTT